MKKILDDLAESERLGYWCNRKSLADTLPHYWLNNKTVGVVHNKALLALTAVLANDIALGS